MSLKHILNDDPVPVPVPVPAPPALRHSPPPLRASPYPHRPTPTEFIRHSGSPELIYHSPPPHLRRSSLSPSPPPHPPPHSHSHSHHSYTHPHPYPHTLQPWNAADPGPTTLKHVLPPSPPVDHASLPDDRLSMRRESRDRTPYESTEYEAHPLPHTHAHTHSHAHTRQQQQQHHPPPQLQPVYQSYPPEWESGGGNGGATLSPDPSVGAPSVARSVHADHVNMDVSYSEQDNYSRPPSRTRRHRSDAAYGAPSEEPPVESNGRNKKKKVTDDADYQPTTRRVRSVVPIFFLFLFLQNDLF